MNHEYAAHSDYVNCAGGTTDTSASDDRLWRTSHYCEGEQADSGGANPEKYKTGGLIKKYSDSQGTDGRTEVQKIEHRKCVLSAEPFSFT